MLKKIPSFNSWPKKKLFIGVICLTAVLLVSFFVVNKNNKAKASTANYATMTVQQGTVEETIDGTGTLKPAQRYALKTWSGGSVEQVLVSEGATVTQGQPLMVIKNDELASSAKQAALEWEISQKDLNDMYSPPGESDSIRRAAELKVEQAQIALQDAKDVQDSLIVKAPFDGTLLENKVVLGQRVTASTAAATFATADEMEVVASFSDTDINSISKDMAAQIFVKGLNKTYDGKVKEVAFTGASSSTSSTSGTFQVILTLDNPDDSLRSGMQTYNTVIIVRDTTQDVFIYKQASGYLRYTHSEDMTCDVSGTVKEIYHQPGDKLTKGAPILRIENAETDRSVKDAGLQLSNAEEALNTILHPDSDTIKSQELKVEQNYQKVLTAQKKTDSLNAVAPIDGIVTNIAVSAGDELGEDSTSAGQELLVVCNFAKNYLEINVDELDINKIKFGQEATVKIDALPNAVAKGKVIGIAQEGTTSDGVTKYAVTLEVDYVEGIKGGMSATATISLDKKENVLRIPSEALVTTNGRSTVQVLQNGQPVTKPVKTGVNTGKWVEITEGLNLGEQVVVANATKSATTNQQFGGPPPDMGGGFGGGGQRSTTTTTRRQ